MDFKGIKIYAIIIVVLLVIGLFFVGKTLYRVYNIDKPIKEELLALEGVNDINIIKNDGKVDLHLSLLPDQDFYTLYQEIENIKKDRLGNKNGDIIILNKVNKLQEVYHEIHFAIYEGINTSKFLDMDSNVKKIAEKEELDDCKLWVDNNAVYIKLDKNNLSFYKRIPYNKTVIVERIGGDYLG